MQVIGLLSWYAESAIWLAATVASAAKCCDHIVAVDGAYQLYPEGRNRSGAEQAAIISEVATAHSMGVTIHTPQTVWEGNEVEKRGFMFHLAETVAEAYEDWYFVLDADEVILDVPADFRQLLEHTEHAAGEVTFVEHKDPHLNERTAEAARKFRWDARNSYPIRTLFRALPGLTVDTNHYTYRAGDRLLWGNDHSATVEPALDVTDLRIEHRSHLRDLVRQDEQKTYYKRREDIGIEKGQCEYCEDRASEMLIVDPEPEGDSFTARTVPVCASCLPGQKERSAKRIKEMGFDPTAFIHAGAA
jgi:hypothetical protein